MCLPSPAALHIMLILSLLYKPRVFILYWVEGQVWLPE